MVSIGGDAVRQSPIGCEVPAQYAVTPIFYIFLGVMRVTVKCSRGLVLSCIILSSAYLNGDLMPALIPDAANSRFTILAVRKSNPEPLLQMDIPWERLMEDVVEPYDSGEMFFIDGAPVKASEMDRLKILVNGPQFQEMFAWLNQGLRASDAKKREVTAKNYHVLVEALLRERCTDITSQVVSAFRTAVKPKLSDRLPDKKVLFDAAIKLLIEGTRAWSGHGA